MRKNRLILYCDLVYNHLLGYDLDDYITFRFWEKNCKEQHKYLSFRENSRLALRITPPNVFNTFLDKSLFNKAYSQYIKRDWKSINGLSKDEIYAFVREYKTVIIKPTSDYGGAGIVKVSLTDTNLDEEIETIYNSANEAVNVNNLIMEECIVNHPLLETIAPTSLNTIRVVTVIDSCGKVHIPAALLRMGNGKAITDNYHSGGMACPIDLETGCLTKEAHGLQNATYSIHPYSGISFLGYKIPRFDYILSLAEEIALENPKARYVGWDFAITQRGVDVIEGNIPPGEHITQIASGPIRDQIRIWLKQ